MSDITERIIDLANAAELEWRSYSGRGMYGDRCFAITTASPERTIVTLFSVALEMDWDREELQALCEALDNPLTDSMGTQSVVYWPAIECNQELEGSDE
jgi:hypothetical protein